MTINLKSFDEIISEGGTGRHETFTPRYGWLKKGFDAITEDERAFNAPDAIERLGVGKNMVSSIKFWCQAFKLISYQNNGGFQTTEFGDRLLDTERGWDPYLEDIASLWLLHWQLFIPKLEAVSWSIAFNKGIISSFDLKQLSKIILNYIRNFERFKMISDSSIERDASCLIRMYLDESSSKESEIDCPFTQLALIHKVENNFYSFSNNEKSSLPALIFAAACCSYMKEYVQTGQRTIALSSLTYNPNSPGVIFKVPESSVGSYLHKAQELLDGKIQLANQLGSIHVHFSNEPEELYFEALEKYYTKK